MRKFCYGFIIFLKNWKQSVVVDGKQSSLIDVESGVPQGTVLGPLLFLLHINDLPSVVSSKVRLFADDCLIYRNIKNKEDQIALQKDLNFLENWGNTWGMRFNAAKCNIMPVSRTRDPKLFNDSLTGQVLEDVMDAKYLGVTLSNDLGGQNTLQPRQTRLTPSFRFCVATLKAAQRSLSKLLTFVGFAILWSMAPLFGTHTRSTTVTKLRGCSVPDSITTLDLRCIPLVKHRQG